MLFAVHEMFPLAKTDVACKKKNTEQENALNIVVHEMLCLAKTDVAWKRGANQFQLSVQQIYNTEIQFRVKSNFSFKRFFALSRHLFTKQKLSPGGKLIVHRLSLPCKKCTWAKLYGLHRLCNQTQSFRVRTAGASRRGVKRSGGRHNLPPARQASQSFFNKENNLQLSGRRLFPPSVGNQDNSPTGRTFGRVSPLCENLASLPWGSSLLRRTGRLASVIADEDFPLDLKQGTPWTSNHGAGGRCFISVSRKNLPK